MSIRLRELIKRVRECKTAAEERAVIQKEAAEIRTAFKEEKVYAGYRHRNLSKLMYMHMLGYPTHWGQMECLKLISEPLFPQKRIGYLALMVLMDERQELLMMVTNCLKRDLTSRHSNIVGIALHALGNICSTDMARDLAPEVERLMRSASAYVRKKAALCAVRIARKCPEILDAFIDPAAELLADRNHGVLLATTTLMLQLATQSDAARQRYRGKVEVLVRVMKALLQNQYSSDHNVGPTPDPFLQVKILRVLREVGRGDEKASDAMSDILAQVASAADPAAPGGAAVLYECVQTVIGVESVGSLRVLAVNIMGKFLGSRDNNKRYVALGMLQRVVVRDRQAVLRHRATVLECVQDEDDSIRRKALELLGSLVDAKGAPELVDALLSHLSAVEGPFRGELAKRVCLLAQQFPDSAEWYRSVMVRVLRDAGEVVPEEILRVFLTTVGRSPALQAACTPELLTEAERKGAGCPRALALAAAWCAGEFGDVAGRSFPGGPGALVRTVLGLMQQAGTDAAVRDWCCTALVKLAAWLPSESGGVRGALERLVASPSLETQKRACEYLRVMEREDLHAAVSEHIPPLEHSAYAALMAGGDAASAIDAGAGAGAGAADVQAAVERQAQDLAALLDLDLGGGGGGAAPAEARAPGALGGLDDLLGGAAGNGSYAPAPGMLGGLDDLLGGGAPAPVPVSSPSFVVYDKQGLKVVFACAKPGGDPTATTVTATCTNTGMGAIVGLSLQAAVPKTATVKLDHPSGTTIQPGAPRGPA